MNLCDFWKSKSGDFFLGEVLSKLWKIDYSIYILKDVGLYNYQISPDLEAAHDFLIYVVFLTNVNLQFFYLIKAN